MATQAEVLKAFVTGEGLPKTWRARATDRPRYVLEATLGRYGVAELWHNLQIVAVCAEKKYVLRCSSMRTTVMSKLADAITAANQAGAVLQYLRLSRAGVQPDMSVTQVMVAGEWGGDDRWEDP